VGRLQQGVYQISMGFLRETCDAVAVQYLSSSKKISPCGDDYIYTKDGVEQKFTPARGQTIEHRLVMNTPGLKDGVLQAWLGGQLFLDIQDFYYRDQCSYFSIVRNSILGVKPSMRFLLGFILLESIIFFRVLLIRYKVRLRIILKIRMH
jgi:hypothetical protein